MREVVFEFDEHSLNTLQEMTEDGNFLSMGDTVSKSLRISLTLQSQAKQGFTELIVRNPETRETRILLLKGGG